MHLALLPLVNVLLYLWCCFFRSGWFSWAARHLCLAAPNPLFLVFLEVRRASSGRYTNILLIACRVLDRWNARRRTRGEERRQTGSATSTGCADQASCLRPSTRDSDPQRFPAGTFASRPRECYKNPPQSTVQFPNAPRFISASQPLRPSPNQTPHIPYTPTLLLIQDVLVQEPCPPRRCGVPPCCPRGTHGGDQHPRALRLLVGSQDCCGP